MTLALLSSVVGCTAPAAQHESEGQGPSRGPEAAAWKARLAQAHEHAARLQAQRAAKEPAPQTPEDGASAPVRVPARKSAQAARSAEQEREASARAAPPVEVLKPAADPELDIARAKQAVRIEMFSASWCGVCTRARRYFQHNQIRFIEHDVDENAVAHARYRALNPKRSLPTIAIDEHLMVGFAAESFEQLYAQAALARLTRAQRSRPKMIEVGASSPEARDDRAPSSQRP